MVRNAAPEKSLGARTLSGLGWSYLATFTKAFLSLLALMILARLLAPAEFGLFGIAWIFMTLGARFSQSLVGPAIIQRSGLTERHIEAGFALSLLSGAAVAILICLLAPFIGEFFNEPTATRALQALSMIFVINGVGCVPAHLLQRELRFRELMVADVLAYVIGYGFTAVILAFQGYGVWSLVWGELMHRVIYTLMVVRYTRRRCYPRWALREAKELLATGVGFSLARFFELIARQGGHFIIGRWLGATALGYYTRADKLTLAPKNYVSQNLFQVLFPAMAQRQQGAGRLATVYLHGLEVLSLIALPLSVMLYLAAPEIVFLVLGGQWEPVIDLLRILAFIVLFQVCDVLNLAVAGAVGAVYRLAWRQGVHAFLVVGGAWYASRWGLEGVVIVLVGAQVVAYLLLTQLSVALLKLDLRRFLRCCLPALWTGAWAALALWLTAAQLRALALPAGPALVIEGLAWLAAVVAALYYAPSFLRPASFPWVIHNVPLEGLGASGQFLKTALQRLSRQPVDC